MLEIFHTLAEVSVAVTGFSSSVIIFRGNATTDWSRQDYISFGFVLSWSIGSIFLSLLPILMVEFGHSLEAAAQIGCFSVIGYVASQTLFTLQGKTHFQTLFCCRQHRGAQLVSVHGRDQIVGLDRPLSLILKIKNLS